MAADEDLDVPDTGAVFTFGKSKFADNAPNKFWIRDDKVLHVSCGDEHTILVSDSGKVFGFGANDFGQLGLGHTKTVTKPSRLKVLKHETVKLLAAGRAHTLLATESGKLYAFGNNTEGQLGLDSTDHSRATPTAVPSLKCTQYSMLAAGTDHSVALTEDGDVYVWGGGSEGQLGLGEETEVLPKKLPIEEKVVHISCGYYHTAVVTADGKLYMFGETEDGKLGLEDDSDDHMTPQHVTAIEDKVVWVACGGRHTVALTASGKVYTFGDGTNGQLGHGTKLLSTAIPHMVNLPKRTHIRQVSCGENCTALISKKGDLYTFGDGRHGKLGLGEENFANQFSPTVVDRFEKFNVEQVSCGGCHMLVLARQKSANQEWDSADESEEESDDEALNSINLEKTFNRNNHLMTESLDLEGSVAARNRRREKLPDIRLSLNRTLPPLNSTVSSRNSYQLSQTVPHHAHHGDGTHNASLTDDAKRAKDGKGDDSDVSDIEDDSKKHGDHSTRLTKTMPTPKPRVAPRKFEPNSTIKPVPAARTKSAPPPNKHSDDDSGHEEIEDVQEFHSKKQETDEDSEEEINKKKEDQKEKEKKEAEKKKKKKTGFFGRKNVIDSEDDADAESEDSDKEDQTDKKKKEKKKKEKEKKSKKKKVPTATLR